MAENKVKRENYIALQGWMIRDLMLKGNELIIYACIYGFSQSENQVFNGSLQYLADWTNSTKQGVIRCLKSLTEKGYIIKTDKIINGVKFCEYSITDLNKVLNKVEYPIKESLTNGIKQSLPNNISSENIVDIKEDNFLTEFERLWKIYPNKKGKPKALKAYQKARKNGTSFEAVEKGLRAYNDDIKAKGTKTEYIKHGSTWFNNECWNDDYSAVPATGSDEVPEFLKKWSV